MLERWPKDSEVEWLECMLPSVFIVKEMEGGLGFLPGRMGKLAIFLWRVVSELQGLLSLSAAARFRSSCFSLQPAHSS